VKGSRGGGAKFVKFLFAFGVDAAQQIAFGRYIIKKVLHNLFQSVCEQKIPFRVQLSSSW